MNNKLYVAIGNSGLTFSQSANSKLKEYKRCVLLFDRENWKLGICPLKNGRIPASFSLGYVGKGKGNRHVTGIRWLRNEVVPHVKASGKDIFPLEKSRTVPEFEGEIVYLADLGVKAKLK